jgi:hypothetical protein
MPRYKYNRDNQQKEAPGAHSSFISPVVPEDRRWTPGEGVYKFRILPPWSEEGIFAKKVQVYYKVGRDQITFVTPEYFESDTCPFVHAYKQIRAKISGDKGGYERHRDDIKICRPVNRWYANVIVMDELSKGPQLWGFGSKAYEQIMNLIETGEYGDITDPDEGSNLILTLTPGTYGLNYLVHAARQSSPLGNEAWLDMMFDLDNIWVRPNMEDVKKAYLTSTFTVWEPKYLYEDELQASIPNDPASSTGVDDQFNDDDDDIPAFLKPESSLVQTLPVDEVTGAPTDIIPEETPPPPMNPTSSSQAFGSALSLEEKIRAKASAEVLGK